ncbi:RmlC-like cupin [Gonapodya prolifera JEL478]|uniref:RmlC-like cupin n=1 Tax=Gonapodya prolifera (strain JEL478) TaxID=1344416 RepID=A0A139A839_GONPJ|nr:RmlC-like cupin [Gonapodya prolifera JEL478]|eukprot:KXS12950.1 RmlC-like cupin [Gonapodya prolifera JEL478]
MQRDRADSTDLSAPRKEAAPPPTPQTDSAPRLSHRTLLLALFAAAAAIAAAILLPRLSLLRNSVVPFASSSSNTRLANFANPANRSISSMALPKSLKAKPAPLSTAGVGPWTTQDPFLFCVFHHDAYPAGDESLRPAVANYKRGRNMGSDFEGKDGWRMYHGDDVPGFPQHPHRGFETITITKTGLIDHSDSLGAAARFGEGDTQWLTAGKGIVHCEMFPLVHKDKGNPTDFFQIWLNLPKSDKMVDPYFTMIWAEETPTLTVPAPPSNTPPSIVRVIAGASLPVPGATTDGVVPSTPPPPNSYASKPWSNMAIWTVDMSPGGEVTIPALANPVANPQGHTDVTRVLYFFAGDRIALSDPDSDANAGPVTVLTSHASIALHATEPTLVRNTGEKQGRLLMLQASPLGEPVAQHGPFVMNTRQEIFEAFMDYRETQFGGWRWPNDEPTHGGLEVGRFARHPGGEVTKKFEGKVRGEWGQGWV